MPLTLKGRCQGSLEEIFQPVDNFAKAQVIGCGGLAADAAFGVGGFVFGLFDSGCFRSLDLERGELRVF